MPCSRFGQSNPSPGPPQDCSRFPWASKTRTGGAAKQHWDSGGVCAAPNSSTVSKPGRCRTQMWSWRSTAMPPTCPMIQLFGNSLGQNGSTLNFGASRTSAVPVLETTNKPIPKTMLSIRVAGAGGILSMRKVFSYRKGLRKPIGCKRCRKRITLRRRGRKGTAEQGPECTQGDSMLQLPAGEFCTIVHRFAQVFDANLIDGEKWKDYFAFRLNREA